MYRIEFVERNYSGWDLIEFVVVDLYMKVLEV
jgi:hypothetical protein